jgi:radical SAM superfamily enzyme YgiQ (UPF0313 family)
MADYTNVVQDRLSEMQQADVFLPRTNPTFGNPPFSDAAPRILIARLSPFADVDRSLPHLFLFQEVRRALPRTYIDLAFFPARAERAWFERENISPLIGVQSLHSIEDFDLVLFSNAYILELINLPYLLMHSDLPLFASERRAEHPILILGGSNAMASQVLICVTERGIDALVDGIFFGEGEGYVGRLVTVLANGRKSKKARLIQAAAEIEGFWAAGFSPTVTKAACEAVDADLLPSDYPLLNSAEAGTARLQINYGCSAFCTFCFEAYDRRPYREIPLPDLIEAARRIKRAQGARTIDLYSFNFNTHQEVLLLLPELHRLFERVSFQSQRVDILQHTPTLLESEIAAGKRSFTVGIEGISERQRTWLHKSLPTADISTLLERLLSSRVREVKLFYLLTGHETPEDLAEFRQFVRAFKNQRRATRRRARVVFSFGLLIRMPFTPLRYDRLYLEESHWRPLIGQAKSACETNGFEFRLAFDWPAYAVSQVLSLGGSWLVEALLALAREGFCFDSALPAGYWEQLQGWMQEQGQWTCEFLSEKDPAYPFALDLVRSNVPSAFLYRQFQEAKAGLDGGYCLGSAAEQGHCLGCGACANPEQRSAIVRHRVRSAPGSALANLRDMMARKQRLKPLYIRVRVAAWLAGAQPAYLNAALLKELLSQHPPWTENLLSASECLFTVRPNDRRFPPLTGETVFALKTWDSGAIANALAADHSPTRELGSSRDGSAFDVLGLAEDFEPGVYSQVGLDLVLPARYFSDTRAHLERYLRDAYLPYSLRRISPGLAGETRFCFDVPKKGLKKKILYAGTFSLDERGMHAHLEIGPGFDLLKFLEMFYERAHCHVQAHITNVVWSNV